MDRTGCDPRVVAVGRRSHQRRRRATRCRRRSGAATSIESESAGDDGGILIIGSHGQLNCVETGLSTGAGYPGFAEVESIKFRGAG
jgi:hypothetical protein